MEPNKDRLPHGRGSRADRDVVLRVLVWLHQFHSRWAQNTIQTIAYITLVIEHNIT